MGNSVQLTPDGPKSLVTKPAKRIAKLEETAGQLEKLFSTPRDRNIDPETMQLLPDHRVDGSDFKFLGTGTFRDVYLHKPTNTVFKVDHSFSIDNSKKMVEAERKSYESINAEQLAKDNMRYVNTDFITSPTGRPMVVQEAVIPSEHGYNDPSPIKNQIMATNNSDILFLLENKEYTGISDLQENNVLVDNDTKEIILFDCLEMPQEFYDLREENLD